MADLEQLAQDVEALKAKVSTIETIFARFMKDAYTAQRDFLNHRVVPLVEAFESGDLKPKAKRTRKVLNQEDWMRVQGMLDNDGNASSWKYIAEQTGIPQSTCRKYAKMTQEESLSLPQSGEPESE